MNSAREKFVIETGEDPFFYSQIGQKLFSTKYISWLEERASLPTELTAENGAKHLLIGEFFEETSHACPECDGDGCFEIGPMDPTELCDICEGSGNLLVKTPVEWTTIKNIYRKIVEHYK